MPILEKVHDLWEHVFLLHVPLHGQYHRGKINLLLRQAGRQPAPTDYITFVRGVSAATEEAARRSSGSG